MIRILLSTRLGERKWTQADLVRETGIRASTINDLYHEMTDRVSLEQLDQICKALDCDIFHVFYLFSVSASAKGFLLKGK